MSNFELDGSKLSKDEIKRRIGFIDEELTTKDHTRKFFLDTYNDLLKKSSNKKKILNCLGSEKKESTEGEAYSLRSLNKKRERGSGKKGNLNTPHFRTKKTSTTRKNKKLNFEEVVEEEEAGEADVESIIKDKQMNISSLYDKIEKDLKEHKMKYGVLMSSGKKGTNDYSFGKSAAVGSDKKFVPENDPMLMDLVNPLASRNFLGENFGDLNTTLKLNETIYIEEPQKARVSTISIRRDMIETPNKTEYNISLDNNKSYILGTSTNMLPSLVAVDERMINSSDLVDNEIDNSNEFRTRINDIKIAGFKRSPDATPKIPLSPRANKLIIEYISKTSEFKLSNNGLPSKAYKKVLKYLPVVLGTGLICLYVLNKNMININEQAILISLGIGIVLTILIRFYNKRNYLKMANDDVRTITQLLQYNQLQRNPVGLFEDSLVRDLAYRHGIPEARYRRKVLPLIRDQRKFIEYEIVIQNQSQRIWKLINN
jgi:hypothetical protein